MADHREYRLKIDGFTRETMPMRLLSEFLSDMAILFGEDHAVHLIAIESGSACPVVLVDWEAEPIIVERVTRARDGEGPKEPIDAIKRINARLEKQNTSADLIGPARNKVIVFPGYHAAKPIEWPSVNQAGEFCGIPIAVGGKNDPVPVHLLDGKAEYDLLAGRMKAKEIAVHLFESVLRVYGRGRWRKTPGGPWSCERFVIEDFEVVKLATFDEALDALRGIDAQWKHLDDPVSVLRDIRTGNANEGKRPNGRV
jgi:hypothetical protein